MNLRFPKIALAAAPFLLLIPLFTASPAPVRLVIGFAFAYYVPGLTAFLFLSEKPFKLDHLFIPLLLSPVVESLLVLALARLGASPPVLLRIAAAFLCVLFAAAVLTRKGGPSSQASPIPRAVVAICFGFAGLILVSYIVNGFLLVRSDAWYHASITSEIIDRGIPPKEPWLPDTPIRYMWIYHLFIASGKELMGLTVFQALGLFNIVNAFVFPYLIARFTALFSTKARSIIGAPLFSIAGLESPAWILWVVSLGRAFFGGTKGLPEVSRILGAIDLNSERVIYFLSPFEGWQRFGNYMVNTIDKFLTVTPFNHALNLFLCCFIVAISVDLRKKAVLRPSIAAFVLMLAALLFHVIIGAALILTVVGSGCLLFLVERLRYKETVPRYHTIILPIAAMLATAFSMPYLWRLVGENAGGVGIGEHFHLGIRNLVTIGAPLAVLFLPARRAIRDIFSFADGRRKILSLWLVSLFVLNAFVNLPTRNESKLVFPFFMLLCPPVAWAIIERLNAARGARLALKSLVVAVLFAVPPILTVRGFMLDKPANAVEERRDRVTPEDRDIFAWIRKNSSRDAVVIESNEYELMPVYAHRRELFPTPKTVAVLGYRGEAVDRSSRIRDELATGEPLTQGDIDFVRSLRVQVFIVLWREDLDARPGLDRSFASRPGLFEKRYENSRALIYSLR
jgi:hypothetical protein